MSNITELTDREIEESFEEIDEDALYLLGLSRHDTGRISEKYIKEIEEDTNISQKYLHKLKNRIRAKLYARKGKQK